MSKSLARRLILSCNAPASSRVNSSHTRRSSEFFSRNSCSVNGLSSSASSFLASSSPSPDSEIITICIPENYKFVNFKNHCTYVRSITHWDWAFCIYEKHRRLLRIVVIVERWYFRYSVVDCRPILLAEKSGKNQLQSLDSRSLFYDLLPRSFDRLTFVETSESNRIVHNY